MVQPTSSILLDLLKKNKEQLQEEIVDSKTDNMNHTLSESICIIPQ